MQPYTMQNTIHDVFQETPILPFMHLLYPHALMRHIPEECRHIPLPEVEKRVMFPWGASFDGRQFLQAAALARDIAYSGSYEILPLWQSGAENLIPDIENNDSSSVFLLRKKPDNTMKRRCAVICPGGAYETLAFVSEGIEYAQKLEELGFAAFILSYRFAPNRYPLPQYDLMLAIKYLRANAQRFSLDPSFVLAAGSSAGGHLCASTACLYTELEEGLEREMEKYNLPERNKYRAYSARPDALCLSYPVISFLREQHEPSFQALTGGDETLREKLSVEEHIGKSYPETFVWACLDDSLVPPSNTKRMGDALTRAGVKSMCILYPQGEHGCGLGCGTSAEGWIDQLAAFL